MNLKGWSISGCVLLMLLSLFSVSFARDFINFGVLPLENHSIMYKKFLPLAKFLEAETGMKVKLIVGKTYQKAMDDLGDNTVQISYLSPTTFPKCEVQNPNSGIEPILRFLNKGHGTYKSCIIIPANSSITEIAQLKGKRFAFGDANSTSSHLMPRSMLAAEGITLENLEEEYVGSHSKVANKVSIGVFAGGGVKESVADKESKNGRIKILKKSDPIPQFPICINNHLSKKDQEKIISAFNKLNDGSEKSKKILTSINKKFTGVESTETEDYDVIRNMIKNLYGNSFYKKDS